MSRVYRHELKFFCGEMELRLLEDKIKHVCTLDPHVGAEGVYRIKSMYFDTLDFRCLQENEDGADHRSKYRIRIYNDSGDVINLERKGSVRNRKYKDSCRINPKQYRQIVDGCPVEDVNAAQGLLAEFLAEKQMDLLRPSVIVEYVRTPYIYPVGNVRITFDRYIKALDSRELLNRDVPGRGILPEHMHILEVKYDEIFPSALLELLNGTCSLRRTSFSKYALCKQYNIR